MRASPSFTILLADDDVMIRNLVRETLQDQYALLSAADGDEALELSRAHPKKIDLLLTDVEMPGMDGISVYRQMRAERPNLRVLFVSGASLPEPDLGHSPAPFLAKPFKLNELKKRVATILQGDKQGKDRQTILVVDSNSARRERTAQILMEDAYTVLTATSTEEAEVISDGPVKIDLVVSGVVFPGASGVQLAEHVDQSEREISTLLISHFHREFLHAIPGFSEQPEFLPNPFTSEALLTRVRQLLSPSEK